MTNFSSYPWNLHNPFSSVTITFFFLFLTIIHKSLSARSLTNPSQSHHHHRHGHRYDNRAISFYMLDVLSEKNPTSEQVATRANGQLPFSKPLGYFPPVNGIPLSIPDYIPMTGQTSQTLDIEGIGMTFPAIATLNELELGTVTTIDEDIYEGSDIFGPSFLGKAQGIYVASTEDGSSHMVAMTASFASNEYKDSLRFFGVHTANIAESHIAVIGGTGRYQNANGYAIVKTVKLSSSSSGRNTDGAYKLLQVDVYLG